MKEATPYKDFLHLMGLLRVKVATQEWKQVKDRHDRLVTFLENADDNQKALIAGLKALTDAFEEVRNVANRQWEVYAE